MKKKKNLLPLMFVILSVICLVLGVVFYIKDHPNIITIVDNTTEDLQLEVSITELEPEEQKIPNKDTSSSKEETVEGEDEKPPVVSEATEPEPEPEPEPEIVRVENPYKESFLKNEDMVAWIKIPDTTVDAPVMWTPQDEDYYLYKDINKKKSRGGCPILDTDSTMYPASTNLIIHGHNIKGIMFYDLLNYKKQSYRDEHPYIYLYGEDYLHVYEVMAVFRSQVYYTTDTCFKYYKFFNANSEEEFKDYYDNVKALSLYDTGVGASYGDKLVTLSTCSSHVENGRFVVVGKEIEATEYYLPIHEETNNNAE